MNLGLSLSLGGMRAGGGPSPNQFVQPGANTGLRRTVTNWPSGSATYSSLFSFVRVIWPAPTATEGRIWDSGTEIYLRQNPTTGALRFSNVSSTGIQRAPIGATIPATGDIVDILVHVGPAAAAHPMMSYSINGGAWITNSINTSADTAYGSRANFSWLQSTQSLVRFTGAISSSIIWQGGTYGNISTAAVRELFVDPATGRLTDFADAIAAYGTPLEYVQPPAANFTAGTNFGSGGNYVVTGTFLDLGPPQRTTEWPYDRVFTQNTGTVTRDLSVLFEEAGSYALTTNPDPSNITINLTTGVLSVNTDATGVLSAAPVVVTASNQSGGATASFAVSVEAASTLAITANVDNGVEPVMVRFGLVGRGDLDFDDMADDLEVAWTFDDAGSEYESLPVDHPWGVSANTAFGTKTAHTFMAGSYTVSATVYDRNGDSQTITKEITVTAKSAHSWDKIIAYSAGGTFTGKPSGAVEVTTPAGLVSELAGQAGNDVWISFNGGEEQDFGSLASSIALPAANLLRVDAFGTGKPDLQWAVPGITDRLSLFSIGNCTNAVFENIKATGDYSGATGTRSGGGGYQNSLVRHDNNTEIVYHRCEFRGLFLPIGMDVTTGAGALASDCYFYDTKQRSIYSDNSPNYIFGCYHEINTSATTLDTATNDDTVTPDYPDSDSPRLTEKAVPDTCVFMSDFHSIHSTQGPTFYQPAFRFGVVASPSSINVVMDRVKVREGSSGIAPRHQDVTAPHIYGNWVIDRFVYDAGPFSIGAVSDGTPGLIVRNSVSIKRNEAQVLNSGTPFGFHVGDLPSAAINTGYRKPVLLFNNSHIVLQSSANNGAANSAPLSANAANLAVTETNNIVHAPNLTTPLTTQTPLDASALYRPLAGSSAIGSATGRQAVLDFFGTVRTTSTRGAFDGAA